jgi:hypothetical protein
MLPFSALNSMNVLFATPCYIFGVSMNYVASTFSLALDSKHVGLPCTLHLHSESLITRGRNVIVLKFLAEEQYTHLFWIDSDITFQPESVFRLLQADRDVAAGVYPIKRFNWPPPLARHRRQGLRRPAMQAGAPGSAHVSRQPRRKPAPAGAVVDAGSA